MRLVLLHCFYCIASVYLIDSSKSNNFECTDDDLEQIQNSSNLSVHHFRCVSSSIGRSVFMLCDSDWPTNFTRSWVRYRDTHILTVGDYIYTSEYRIQIKADYQLHIKWLQTNDSGIYLCEINTNPFYIIYYYLNVKVPNCYITGDLKVYLKMGSTMNLTCIIENSIEPPEFLFWYHNNDVLHNMDDRNIKIMIEKGDITKSSILISSITKSDYGLYTCSPSNTNSAHAEVIPL